MKNRKKAAIIRAVAAVVLAVAALFATGFGALRLIGGPQTVSDASELVVGTYVETDITYIMDICGVEHNFLGDTTAYYAIAPVGNRFVMIRFPASYLSSITRLEEGTRAFLDGTSASLPLRIHAVGTVVDMTDEAVAQLMVDWFNENASWMSQAGVISTVEDYSVYLDSEILAVDQVRNVSYALAVAAAAAAVALLVYAAAELTLAGLGKYNDRPRRRADA